MGDMNITDNEVFAGGIGLSALTGYAKYQQANADYEQALIAKSLENQSAQLALMGTIRQLEVEQDSAAEQAISSSIALQKASAVAKGKAISEAGASGMGGKGVDMQVQDVSTEASRAESTAAMNLESKQKELNTSAKIATTQANNRMTPMQAQQPSPWAIAASSGISGFRNVVALRDLQRKGNLL